MILTKHSLNKIKIGFTIIVFIISLNTISLAHAVSYHFEEDFSQSLDQLDNWSFYSVEFSSETQVSSNHNFIIDNNELVSSGVFSGSIIDLAYIEDTTAFGGWSFDLYVPSTISELMDPYKGFGGISISKSLLGLETNYSIFTFDLRVGGIGVNANNGTAYDNLNYFRIVPEMVFDKIQHYDMVRTPDRFYVFLENQIVINHTFTFNLDNSINYVSLTSFQGINVKFDNLQITTDYNGLVDEITKSTTTANENESSSENETIILVIGSSVVTLTVGVVVWQTFKKKG